MGTGIIGVKCIFSRESHFFGARVSPCYQESENPLPSWLSMKTADVLARIAFLLQATQKPCLFRTMS